MNNELNPCGCGATPIEDGKSDDLCIRCEKCGMRGPSFDFIYDEDEADIDRARGEAVAAWNASHPLTPPAASGQQDQRVATLIRELRGIGNSTRRGVGARVFDMLALLDSFEKNAAHPAPAQQESATMGDCAKCKAIGAAYKIAKESAPAPATLTPSQIDDLAFGYVPSGKIGELREFAAAILATARAAPAETPNDSSMPVDMSEAKRWIVQLRGRVDHLLGVINSAAPAEQAMQWMPIDSAPKDGREVILAVKMRAGIKHGVLVGHYMGGGHCIEDHPPIDAGWYFWNGCQFDRASVPTHWMPMPNHPDWISGGWQCQKQNK